MSVPRCPACQTPHQTWRCSRPPRGTTMLVSVSGAWQQLAPCTPRTPPRQWGPPARQRGPSLLSRTWTWLRGKLLTWILPTAWLAPGRMQTAAAARHLHLLCGKVAPRAAAQQGKTLPAAPPAARQAREGGRQVLQRGTQATQASGSSQQRACSSHWQQQLAPRQEHSLLHH